jgi:fructokinase
MKFKVLGIGEVLWDVFPFGRKMGGAPANFAYHARALGADARVVSRVGNDALGTEIIERLEALNVLTYCISVDPTHPTGTVTVEVAADGQPCFTIHEGVAWDHLEPDPALMMTLAGADAVCFGTLGQRCEPSRSTIRTLIGNAPKRAVRVFDVNLRQDFFSRELIHDSLNFANVLKLNDAELPVVARLLGLYGSSKDQIATLLERYDLHLIACTRGAKGSLLYNGKEWCDCPGLPSEVKDTVGAGDSFTAAITLGTLAGWPIEKLSSLANEVAAYVCSCDGATPPMPENLRAHFQSRLSALCSA